MLRKNSSVRCRNVVCEYKDTSQIDTLSVDVLRFLVLDGVLHQAVVEHGALQSLRPPGVVGALRHVNFRASNRCGVLKCGVVHGGGVYKRPPSR